MIHAYPRAVYVTSVIIQDVVLLLALGLLALTGSGAFVTALVLAIPLVIAWGVVTLHFPSRVTWDDDAISFAGYGRAHTFAWRDVKAVHVRRFLVKDRVLVRLTPSAPFRGRYWILRSIDGFEELVTKLERTSR